MKKRKTDSCELKDHHRHALNDHRLRIHRLLHWWIGLKACNVILARERLDRERRKKAENRQARAEAEHASQHGEAPASFVALAPNSVLHDVDTGSRGSPMSSSAMLTPPESGESPIAGPGEGPGFTAVNSVEPPQGRIAGLAAVNTNPSHVAQQQHHQNIADGVWNRFAASEMNGSRGHVESKAAVQQQIALAEQSAVVGRQVTEKVAQLVGSFRVAEARPEQVPQSNANIPYRGLDYNSLRALRAYIYNEDPVAIIEEEALFDRLERVWRELVRADSDKILEDVPRFVARERAFLTWVELKRHVAAFERAEKRKSFPKHTSYARGPYTHCLQVGRVKALHQLKSNVATNSITPLWVPQKQSSSTSRTLAKD